MAKNKISDILLKKMTIFRVMVILLILFVIPAFINYDFNKENRFVGAKISLPYLYAGDQIHYYVLVYSLLKDRDIDVRNNYHNSEYNLTYDLGYLFRGQYIGGQVGYFNFKTRDYKPFYEGRTAFETPDPGKDYGKIIIRPLGLPLFYYVLLLPFNFLPNPEPMVVFLTVFLTLIGIYFFFLTLNHLLKDEIISLFFTLLLGISSELWHYSKLFYPDVLQFFLLSLIIYLFIVKDNNLGVGFLFAVGIFARPTFIVLLPFFVLYRFFHQEEFPAFSDVWKNKRRLFNPSIIKKILFLLMPIAMIFFFQMYLNYYFFGNIFSNPNFMMFHFENILTGLWISFFQIDRGLFIFSPIMIFAILGLKSFYNKHKMDSIFIYATISCFVLFLSSTSVNKYFHDTYSIRYYVSIIPYFFIPIAFWYKEVTSNKEEFKKNKIWIYLFYIALIISILINFQAAIFHTLIWGGPPWQIISLLIENWSHFGIPPINLI